MLEMFSNFFSIISNPFKERDENEKLNYFELLGISWLFHFVYAFYSVFAIYLGLLTYDYVSANNTISKMVYSSFNLTIQKYALIIGISEAILYPVVFHFSYRFWVFLLQFYSQIFNVEVNQEENVEDILTAIYASNIYLMIPVLGKLISFIAQGFLLYKGLLKKLNFTNLQAVLVLLTPFFMIFLVVMLMVAYFIFLMSLI